VRVADYICSNKERLIERWKEQVADTLPVSLDASELVDGLPNFIDDLAEAMRDPTMAWEFESAEQHGRHRMTLGMDIGSLIQEMSLVGEVVLQLAAEDDQRPEDQDTQLLLRVIDRGIVTSVRAYAAVRDQEISDLTSVHRHELEQERTALRNLFARTPVPTAVLRGPDDLVFEMANEAFVKALCDAEIVGKPLREALPEFVEQGLDDLLHHVIQSNEAHIAREARLSIDRGRGPEDTWWTLVFAPMRPLEGDTDSVIVLGIEVTDQVRARERIRHSEERYRSIFEAAGVSIWEVDLSDVGARIDAVGDARRCMTERPEVIDDLFRAVRVIDVNAFTLRMFEAASKDQLCSLSSIFGTEAQAPFVNELVALVERRELFGSEARMRTLQGEPVDVVLNFAVPGDDATLKRVLMTLTDITARKRAEEALRESDRNKDEFLAMLGHELRNPLAAIRSATDLVRRNSPEDPRLQRASEVLDRQSKHMTRLIDGLLEVSRISRGKIKLERHVIDLRSTVEAILQDRASDLAAASLALDQRLPPEPVWVYGDAVRLAQIVDNLLANAVKFTEAGGRVTVRLQSQGDQASFIVRDTGIGIEPQMLTRLFEPFQQGAELAARRSDGLGLGLALVKGLVELHGGEVVARSRGPGAGAEFEVRLPLASAPAAQAQPPQRVAPESRRVLIVEDNLDAARMLGDVLQMEGHVVAIADSGPSALEALEARGADVVLCDIGLPEMSGYDVVRAIRERPSLRGIPVVALTGYGQPEDRERSLDAGFDEHFVKPMDLEALDDLLARLPSR
jgi:signal transduction histidine kinase/CheY-like chemotaxis protein